MRCEICGSGGGKCVEWGVSWGCSMATKGVVVNSILEALKKLWRVNLVCVKGYEDVAHRGIDLLRILQLWLWKCVP